MILLIWCALIRLKTLKYTLFIKENLSFRRNICVIEEGVFEPVDSTRFCSQRTKGPCRRFKHKIHKLVFFFLLFSLLFSKEQDHNSSVLKRPSEKIIRWDTVSGWDWPRDSRYDKITVLNWKESCPLFFHWKIWSYFIVETEAEKGNFEVTSIDFQRDENQ